MTAAELFEVVKDVPREAWPELTWDGVEWSNSKRDDDISARIAEHSFIGSMTAELHRKGYTVDSYSTEAGARLYVRDAHTGHDLGGVLKFSASSLVAALAAACKEAA